MSHPTNPIPPLSPNFPSNAEGHFYLHFYAMLGRVLRNLRHLSQSGDDRMTALFDAYPFLTQYEALLTDYSGLPLDVQAPWWEDQIAALEANHPHHLPLRALRTELELRPQHIDLLLSAGLVEENISFGALFAYLQDPLSARLPGLGLLGVLLGDAGQPIQDPWDGCRPLITHQLIYVQNATDPRAEWLVRVPSVIWDGLRGRAVLNPAPGIHLQPMRQFPTPEQLVLPREIATQAQHLPALLAARQIDALVVRGLRGTGRRTFIGSVARALGRGVMVCDNASDEAGREARKLIGPLATLTNTLPILRLNPAPGETADVAPLPGYRGVVGLTLGRSGGLKGDLLAHAFNITLPPPDAAARAELWAMTGEPVAPTARDAIIQRFLLTAGVIHRAAGLASTYCRLEGRPAFGVSDVQQALRSLNRQSLDTLATPLQAVNGWHDLVVGPQVMQELEALETRCRMRENLRAHAGAAFQHTLNRGVRALFGGPSGTGKTLAARALAAALQMDLYRVDLAAVVNKYIGETERNLNEVLSRAEELDVVLLLDEGDALMTRRTEVSNANDRYANLETNYLLQRLEVYEGIVVITTNAAQRIDGAFMRRLDVVIDFGKPDARERWQLWERHLPPAHAIGPEFLQLVSARCELAGGQIRNAALHVALLAMRHAQPANDAMLDEALQQEYRKAGLAYPLKERVDPGVVAIDGSGWQLTRLRAMVARMN
jgi:hypothetical protein